LPPCSAVRLALPGVCFPKFSEAMPEIRGVASEAGLEALGKASLSALGSGKPRYSLELDGRA